MWDKAVQAMYYLVFTFVLQLIIATIIAFFILETCLIYSEKFKTENDTASKKRYTYKTDGISLNNFKLIILYICKWCLWIKNEKYTKNQR